MPSAAPARPLRDARIEALRLAAIAGIGVFHTFMPWFAAATDGSWDAGAPALWALGCVNLLGALGNHVFYMVSGLFLVPAAVRAASRPSGPGWRAQARGTCRRAARVLASVALYAALALAVDAWVAPIDGVGPDESGWLLGGLEFVWVYLALVVATPLMGRVWARLRRPGAAVGALVAAVLAVNAYIAFCSPGEAERDLLEWRKLMSAASYLAGYLAGGLLGVARGRDEAGVGPVRLGSPALLATAACCALAVEGAAAVAGDLRLLSALSYKSTSALSFALAWGAVAAVARPPRQHGREAGPGGGLAARLARWLSPAILGYYVSQSLFSGLWRPPVDGLCADALASGGPVALLACGTVASLVLLAAALVADRLVRVPLLRKVHLS